MIQEQQGMYQEVPAGRHRCEPIQLKGDVLLGYREERYKPQDL